MTVPSDFQKKAERCDFENWLLSKYHPELLSEERSSVLPSHPLSRDGDSYRTFTVQMLWEGWLARASR